MVGIDATVGSYQRLCVDRCWGTENSGGNSCASSRGRQKVTIQKGAKVSRSLQGLPSREISHILKLVLLNEILN